MSGGVRGTSLCESCRHMREVISGKGSRFLLCQMSVVDRRYPRYPPQPVWSCPAHEPPAPSPSDETA